jgi:anti-anti-sigma factor
MHPSSQPLPATAAVVALSGDVDLSARPEVAEALASVWGSGTDHLVIDLRDCTFLDCSCLDLLWQAVDDAPLGGQCVITGAQGSVRRVLALTGFLETVAEVAGADAPPEPSASGVHTRLEPRWW